VSLILKHAERGRFNRGARKSFGLGAPTRKAEVDCVTLAYE
jgi:hypothetical protein